ncbi:unnamed protein product [Linum tenue]|uniref:Uncharacterized protein n=1 Tax=Linum tenue TaxID=586396 RepID=A0AAV0L7I0_9ROSI|nr:unnamed protein product [Linum tenue]
MEWLVAVLAAWFRLKYPHVAIGALASSAPILDFDDLTSPYSFASIVTHDFRSESESCYRVIKESYDLITHTATQPGGVEKLRSSFHLCKKEDVDSLSGWLDTAWIYTAMTDYPTPSNFLQPMPAYPVREMCQAMDDPKTGNDSFAKLFAAASVYYNHSGTAPACFGFGDDYYSEELGANGWNWQSRCGEDGGVLYASDRAGTATKAGSRQEGMVAEEFPNDECGFCSGMVAAAQLH